MILTYIFGISFFVALTMVFVKMYEVGRGEETFISKIFSFFDSLANKVFVSVKSFLVLIITKTKLFFGKRLRDLLKGYFEKLIVWLTRIYKKIVLNDRGVRKLNSNGKVSNYLQEVRKGKDNGMIFDEGTIQEENIEVEKEKKLE